MALQRRPSVLSVLRLSRIVYFRESEYLSSGWSVKANFNAAPGPNRPKVPEDWWYEAFASLPYESSPPGAGEMLTIVAYDITNDKRLRRVARICEDYGVRVQYSVFECRLKEEAFLDFWLKLLMEINEEEDRLVAYKVDARCAKETLAAGTMVCSERAVCYLV